VTEFLTCTSADGTVEVDGVWTTPSKHAADDENAKPSSPLPTIIDVHGGPYYSVTDGFDSLYMWKPMLLAAGYAILQPNYRGSSGRGEAFAIAARGGVGTVEYDDIISLTQHAVEIGYADPERLAIIGWSQGGFASYLASVRNGMHGHGWKFKAAVPGAGVTDWDTMTLTSDFGIYQRTFIGNAPWQREKSDTECRRGSALWEFRAAVEKGDVIPPILIVHGEADERVPLEQAVGFRRALEGAGLPFEMVTYPREPHDFQERKHIVDMTERVVSFMKKHLGPS
jgi:dipeptidyl aminopeptidase/acylaminoacyl peptidase